MHFRLTLKIAIAAAALLAPVSASAAVLGYWQFEDTPGFFEDSSGSARTLTTPGGAAIPTQVALPGSGPGSAFATAVPGTTKAASFDGGDRFRRADEPAFTDTTFTVEALINGSDFATNSNQKSIIGQWNSTGNQRSWLLAVNGSGATAILNFLYSNDGIATSAVSSGLPALAAGTDYYVALAVDLSDTSAGGLTFYQKNLSTGVVSIASVAHAGTTLNDSAALLTIGATDQPSSAFTGLIDEVRYSDARLASTGLLVTVPEPGTAGLAVVVGLAALARRRRPA